MRAQVTVKGFILYLYLRICACIKLSLPPLPGTKQSYSPLIVYRINLLILAPCLINLVFLYTADGSPIPSMKLMGSLSFIPRF